MTLLTMEVTITITSMTYTGYTIHIAHVQQNSIDNELKVYIIQDHTREMFRVVEKTHFDHGYGIPRE